MDAFIHVFQTLPAWVWAFALTVGFVGGLVKGVIGFAMPIVIMSLLSSLLDPETALAALILPTLVTNGVQAMRQGWRAAWASVKAVRLFLAVGAVTLVIAAQFVRVLPQGILFLAIGVPVAVFALFQLSGRPMRLPGASPLIEGVMGGIAGVMSGLSGIWGPPTVAFLTATDTPKVDQVRLLGVVFGLGSVLLALAHIQSGVLRWETLPLSLALVLPALLGLAIGFRVQDQIDQAMFRKVTLWMLLLLSLNLVRRGIF